MTTVALDTQPMIWRLTWRSPEGDKPVELTMSLTSIVDGMWTGEVQVTGYPGRVTGFPVQGCDWVQAHQMMGMWVRMLLVSHLKAGPLYWRGTDVPFVFPEWRRTEPTLYERALAWWHLRVLAWFPVRR